VLVPVPVLVPLLLLLCRYPKYLTQIPRRAWDLLVLLLVLLVLPLLPLPPARQAQQWSPHK
jgi:hypothetical protein